MYDVTNRASFLNAGRWLRELKDFADAGTPAVLIGNKADLASDREVSYEEGEAFAMENSISFVETSAKSAENVHKAFHILGDAVRVREEEKDRQWEAGGGEKGHRLRGRGLPKAAAPKQDKCCVIS